MNLNKHLYLVVLSSILISCGSKSLIPGLEIGMSESTWSKAAGDSFHYGRNEFYPWRLDGSTIVVSAQINSDGGLYKYNDSIRQGSLRVIVIDLRSKEGVDFSKNVDFNPLSDTIVYVPTAEPVCSVQKFDTVLKYLRNTYGKEDSTTYKTIGKGTLDSYKRTIDPLEAYQFEMRNDAETVRLRDSIRRLGGVDTVMWCYHFQTKKSRIVLIRDSLNKGFELVPFDHYANAKVIEYATDYDELLSSFFAEAKQKISASNLIIVPVSNRVVEDDQGKPKIELIAELGNPKNVLFPDDRSIIRVLGKFALTDKYGDTVYSTDNYDITLAEPLRFRGRLGLRYLLEFDQSDTYVYNETYRKIYIDPLHPTAPLALASSFRQGMSFKAIFITEKILFADGTVLKS